MSMDVSEIRHCFRLAEFIESTGSSTLPEVAGWSRTGTELSFACRMSVWKHRESIQSKRGIYFTKYGPRL